MNIKNHEKMKSHEIKKATKIFKNHENKSYEVMKIAVKMLRPRGHGFF